MPVETRTTSKRPAKAPPGTPDTAAGVAPPRSVHDVLTGGGRPSAADVIGVDPSVVRHAVVAHEDREPPSFLPTSGMVEAKATFWTMVAVDPSLVPDRMSDAQVHLILGDKRLPGWLKKSGFRSWFLNKHEHAALADALYDRWIRMAFDRIHDMSDKDFLQLGKLMAEVAKKMPERWMKEKIVDADVARMDDARLIELLLTTAKNMGWKVIVPDGAQGAEQAAALLSSGNPHQPETYDDGVSSDEIS